MPYPRYLEEGGMRVSCGSVVLEKTEKLTSKIKQKKSERVFWTGSAANLTARFRFPDTSSPTFKRARRIRNAIGIADVPEAAAAATKLSKRKRKRKRNKKKTLNNMYVERGGPLEALESTIPGQGMMVGGEAPGK